MRILVISDTHGRCQMLERILKKIQPIDRLIHLGDYENQDAYIKSIAGCPVDFVAGNNDYFSTQPRVKFLEIGKHYVMLTHGHRYRVNYELETIKEAAILEGADIVLFGHTHVPVLDLTDDRIWAVNPGSLSLPRQEGAIPSFLIMEVDQDNEIHFTINYTNQY